MFERLKRLYLNEKLNTTELTNAVIKGWITDAQKQEIIAGK